jgi:peptidoglycan/xylan/chitin deacetylase (PgdA/CDA1 family)
MLFVGYRFVSVDELLETTDKRVIALTVDDAYKSCITNLVPLLDKYKIPALLFVPTLLLGLPANHEVILKNDGYKDHDVMTEVDIDYWLQKGNEIGFHTGGHIDLYHAQNDACIEEDFRKGMEVVNRKGWKTKYFAYPKGYLPKNRVFFESLLNEYGFSKAFTVNWGDSGAEQGWYINRVILGNTESDAWTFIKALGLADFVYKYRRLTKECVV